MARKKLYGAAAAARKKRLAKAKRRRPTTRRKKNPAKRRSTSTKRSAAARKAARTRAANKAKRSRAAKKAALSRRRRRNPAKRRRTAARRSTAVARRRRTYRSNPAKRRRKKPGRVAVGRRRTRGIKAVKAARRSIKYNRRRGGALTKDYIKKFKMRTNPSGIFDAVTKALPLVGSLYLSRVATRKLAEVVPGVEKLGGASRPVIAGGVIVLAHVATGKRGPAMLKSQRSPIMLGAGMNFIDSVLAAFAPQGVKSLFGIEGGAATDAAPEVTPADGYFSADEYVSTDDYVSTSGVEEELGMIQEELGMDEELRALDRGNSPMHALHARSMTRPVGAGGDAMHSGIFAGGWS